MPNFVVNISRNYTMIEYATVEIEADNIEEAEKDALEYAETNVHIFYEDNDPDIEYSIDQIEEIE